MNHDLEKDSESDRLDRLQAIVGRRFADPSLLQRALTHRSFVHEHVQEVVHHNECMEFLGDSILSFVISEELYRRHPLAAEGLLSKARAYLVSAPNLYRLARELDLGRFLQLSFGEEKTGGRKKRALLVDAYEALLAALYLDGGLEAARRFILGQFRAGFDEISVDRIRYADFKSTLQEHLHREQLPTAVYEIVGEVGPDHAKTFVVELRIEGHLSARGEGRTKKEAQQNAARQVLRELVPEAPGLGD